MTWNAERLAELRMLESLLHEVASIDRATGAVERIKWCITIATLLTKSDLRVPRTSFITFLRAQASESERMRIALAHSACQHIKPLDGICPHNANGTCDCARKALDLWAPLSTEEQTKC